MEKLEAIKFLSLELRPELNLEKYASFDLIRRAVPVHHLIGHIEHWQFTNNKDKTELRGKCLKCKDKSNRSLTINAEKNSFHCFAKGCKFSGGGCIDFVAKLFTVTAKEAAHLIAFYFELEPYDENRVSVFSEELLIEERPLPDSSQIKVQMITIPRWHFDYLERRSSELDYLYKIGELLFNVMATNPELIALALQENNLDFIKEAIANYQQTSID